MIHGFDLQEVASRSAMATRATVSVVEVASLDRE